MIIRLPRRPFLPLALAASTAALVPSGAAEAQPVGPTTVETTRSSAAPERAANAALYADSLSQLSGIGQLPDLRPDDWAYQALANLIQRYGCVAGYPNGSFQGRRPISRYEAAALLGACLDRIGETTDELKRLLKEFQQELTLLRGRLDGLERKLKALEASQFATTTKLSGVATFVVGGNAFSGSNSPLVHQARTAEGAVTFNYDLTLTLDTSFNGNDLLRSELRAGNFAQSAWGNGDGLNQLEVAFEEGCGTNADCGDVLAVYRLFYQLPLGKEFTVTLGARVRQDDLLALWPSVYPEDTILDTFSYAGAAGAYNTNLGAGAGLWWKKNGWSISTAYIAANGDFSIGTVQSGETGTVQLGYSGNDGNWAAAAIYNYTRGFAGGVYPGSATPLASLNSAAYAPLQAFGSDGATHSFGLSGYWQPLKGGWLPALNLGWGLNSINPGSGVRGFDRLTSQSWTVGLQWKDALIKGNTAGMAFGQPTFLTACGNSCSLLLGPGQASPRDGLFGWEWWYKFQLSDAISVTPALFYLSNPYGQINKVLGLQAGISGASFNNLGVLVKTTLRF